MAAAPRKQAGDALLALVTQTAVDQFRNSHSGGGGGGSGSHEAVAGKAVGGQAASGSSAAQSQASGHHQASGQRPHTHDFRQFHHSLKLHTNSLDLESMTPFYQAGVFASSWVLTAASWVLLVLGGR